MPRASDFRNRDNTKKKFCKIKVVFFSQMQIVKKKILPYLYINKVKITSLVHVSYITIDNIVGGAGGGEAMFGGRGE